jgi:hypothetical protein
MIFENWRLKKMSGSDWVYCDAYGTNVSILECKKCKVQERQMVSSFEECPYYGKILVRLELID